MVTVDDLIGDREYLGSGFRVKRSGVLIKQQKLWLLQGGHKQCERLTLSAGEKSYFGGETVFKTKTEGSEPGKRIPPAPAS